MNEKARISHVLVKSFRGIPGELEVSFLHPNGKPGSAIIFGDNGSGKSSIVDAVEWACQQAVGRSKAFQGNSVPSLVNLASPGVRCSATVTLSNGQKVSREATFNEDGIDHVGDPVPEVFRRVPMSLKRADILRFLDTPAIKRGSIFIDHALGNASSTPLPSLSADQRSVVEERHEAKRKMREAAAKLATLIGVNPPPRDGNDIAAMIAKDVYKNLPKSDRFKVTLPRAVEESLAEVVKHKEHVGELNQRAKRLQLPTTAVTERLLAMQSLLSGVGEWLTAAFLEVTGASHVRRVQPVFGRLSAISLDIRVALEGQGRTTSPQQVFSEGFQDLIALLYFLAVAKAAGEQGQAKVLILDDVFQSVDASIRVALMEMTVREFKDWQLIVTVHDRLWRNQLRDIFQRAGHPSVDVEIKKWDYAQGPVVVSGGVDPAGSLESSMKGSDPFAVCGIAGRLLEQICDRLSWTIPISVKRKREDAYTLADMWPGIKKELKNTNCAEIVTQVDRWSHLRNAVGAHYNEWAESVTWTEAEAFGKAVLAFYSQAHCASCGQWVERSGSRNYSCRCGTVTVSPAS
ncbi:AAA family ATPase [Streptomyces hydrogenans]|uniref:AAA family ATPase n=1 Tax=Streptomyces hydrogenans TaxID=1873719 RepID=UPI0035D95F51